MSNMKHYLRTGIVLFGIGLVSAGLIGLTYMLTNETIQKNETAKKENAMKEVFSDATKFDEAVEIDGKTYIKTYSCAYKDTDLLGIVYYASGKNAYGEVSLMIGVSSSDLNISVVTNTESYASTLEDNYIALWGNDGFNYETDTSCGATYGAKLIKDMVNEAKADYQERCGN